MAHSEKLHVVVRWGASVVFAGDVPASTGALRIALDDSHCAELAARLSVVNGEVWVDEAPPQILGDAGTQYIGAYGVEASESVNEPEIRKKTPINRRAALGFGVALFVHSLTAFAIVGFGPVLATPSDDASVELARLAVEAQTEERTPAPPELEGPPNFLGGEDGGRGRGREGLMGSRTALATHAAYAMKGADAPRSAKGSLPDIDVASFGMIGLLASPEPDHLVAGWGERLQGTDARFARGEMWGADLGDSFGVGGLGLSGIGEGGGGRREGVGLRDDVDGFGRGAIGYGCGCALDDGFGNGRLSGSHRSQVPKVRAAAADPGVGRLPPDAIQRVVRQSFGRFRACYEEDLRTRPNLPARVTVSFVIGANGCVVATKASDSALSPYATACVVRVFANLSFPEPEGDTVRVVYPIAFEPS